MTQGKRVALSAAQRTELWSRWKTGQSLHVIGRAFGKPHNSIMRLGCGTRYHALWDLHRPFH
jgi:hypothetical protein